MILKSLGTSASLERSYNVVDLVNHTWLGDVNMERWRNSLDEIMEGMCEDMSEVTKCDLLMKEMENSEALKNEVEHYRRQPLGHRDRSYDFLRGSIDRHLDRQRETLNRNAKIKSLEAARTGPDKQQQQPQQQQPQGGGGGALAAADHDAAAGKTKKGGGKGKGKEMEKSSLLLSRKKKEKKAR
jgi:hypothetical protein